MPITFDIADPIRDRADLLRMNTAHIALVAEGVRRVHGIDLVALVGAAMPVYAERNLEALFAYAPPEGVFYLARRAGRAAGMGGLRPVRPGVVEMKRLFVPDEERGHGVGAAIVKRLIADARAFGYARMVLDSAPFQTAAHRLYAAEGFVDIPPYPEVEIPAEAHHDWRFMGLALSAGGAGDPVTSR